MNIDAVSSLMSPSLAASASDPIASAAIPDLTPPDGVTFDTLVSNIEALNQRLVASTDAVHAIALGQVDNLHEALMSGEQTRLAFDLFLQVRGKVLDAYQELLRMQV